MAYVPLAERPNECSGKLIRTWRLSLHKQVKVIWFAL
jgi:hypothetical protein